MSSDNGNPFFWGRITTGEYFADRKGIVKEIILDISSGKNLILYGPRRIGKTSLISEVFNQINQKNDFHTILIDLFDTDTIESIAGKIFRELAGNVSKASEFAKKTIRGIGIKTIGDSLELTLPSSKDILTQTLNVLKRESEKGKKIVIAFDEFQEMEIIDKTLIKSLRSHIQTHQHISYIFTGSHYRLIEMITDQNQPFYKFGKVIQLYKPDINEIRDFLIEKFSKSNITIEETNIEMIIEKTKNLPYYTFLLANELWNSCYLRNVNEINEEMIENEIIKIITRYNKIFEEQWGNLTKNQRTTLKILSNTNFPYKSDILIKYKITSTSIQRTVKSLKKQQFLWNQDKKIELLDPFFGIWISDKEKFNMIV